ncbi:hypothetical protein J2X63_003441 [Agromyces sp. 3263]|nr:hypothetical protein [Agromyces sp. 3263]
MTSTTEITQPAPELEGATAASPAQTVTGAQGGGPRPW